MIVFLFVPVLFFTSYNAHQAYKSNDFEKAKELLEQQQVDYPDDPIVNYNLGATYYKQKKYDQAKKSFRRSVSAPGKDVQEKSCFNLGNSFYQTAFAKMKESPQMAIADAQQAIAQYKKALEITPDNERTKTNKKAAEELLAQLQKQQKQNKQDKKQDEKKEQKKQEQQKQQQKQNLKKDMKEKREKALLKQLQDQEKQLQKKLLKEKANKDEKPRNSYQKPW